MPQILTKISLEIYLKNDTFLSVFCHILRPTAYLQHSQNRILAPQCPVFTEFRPDVLQ